MRFTHEPPQSHLWRAHVLLSEFLSDISVCDEDFSEDNVVSLVAQCQTIDMELAIFLHDFLAELICLDLLYVGVKV